MFVEMEKKVKKKQKLFLLLLLLKWPHKWKIWSIGDGKFLSDVFDTKIEMKKNCDFSAY